MTITKYPEGEIYSKITAAAAVAGTNSNNKSSTIAVIFIHAAIADHTLWDAQVDFLSTKGITCVQYDVLGFGSSAASQAYLTSEPRPEIDHMKHISDLIERVKRTTSGSVVEKVVIAGLSMGAGFALRFATLHPDVVVDGVVCAAGVVAGYNPESWPKEEEEKDEAIEVAVQAGEIEKAARMQVAYWADGPLQKEGRCASEVRERLYKWCFDIAKRRFDKTGGSDLPRIAYPAYSQETLRGLNVPFAVALGRFDETVVNGMMEYLANAVKEADLHRFDSGHMINLECPDEFNQWLYSWIEQKVM